LTEKKYTTMAGALVFFLLMSLVPFTFLATLFFGKRLAASEELLDLPVFTDVKDWLVFFRDNAVRSSSGATFFLAVTSLWSASTFFYQLRRCGEIIYGERRRGGWKVRLSAVLLTLLTMALLTAFAGIYVFAVYLFRKYFPAVLAEANSFLFLLVLAFFTCWALNAYSAPRRIKPKEGVKGSVITSLLWGVAVIFFSLWLRFSRMEQLYGAMTALIVFLLWAYIMMVCFIVGVIYNEHYADKHGQMKKF
jgi:membrane protein